MATGPVMSPVTGRLTRGWVLLPGPTAGGGSSSRDSRGALAALQGCGAEPGRKGQPQWGCRARCQPWGRRERVGITEAPVITAQGASGKDGSRCTALRVGGEEGTAARHAAPRDQREVSPAAWNVSQAGAWPSSVGEPRVPLRPYYCRPRTAWCLRQSPAHRAPRSPWKRRPRARAVCT